MNIPMLDNPAATNSNPATRIIGRDLTSAQRSFSQVLGKALPETKPQTVAEKARDTAEQFVTISLVQPLLKQLRETNNAAPPFAPTEGEKQFRALTDAPLPQTTAR